MFRLSPRAFLLTIGLPVITLLLGWQLGSLYERTAYESRLAAWNAAFEQTGSGDTLGDPEQTANMKPFWTVWRLLQKNYIDPKVLQPSSLMTGAMRGLVQGVGDPYTLYMPPSENEDFRRSLEGKLQGIGAELTEKDGVISVVMPLKGSPAESAGLLPGDIIAKVDGQSVDGWTLNDVVSHVRGKKGTTVALQIYREGQPEPLEFSITRDDVNVPTVESRIITQSGAEVGYVALNQFGENSMAEMRDALRSFKDETLAGIVLDLRFNGGGYLDGAVDLVSMFLKEGEVVAVESRGGKVERHDVSGHPLYPDVPLAVLINQSSASASEIAAGALQDHGRAVIVGMKSFGKGTVQEVIDLPDGSSLRVTIARWLTPNGKNLGKEGVQPDVKVERAASDVSGKKDTQLEKAVQTLLSGKK